jgi:hypothetical protein
MKVMGMNKSMLSSLVIKRRATAKRQRRRGRPTRWKGGKDEEGMVPYRRSFCFADDIRPSASSR